MIKNPTYVTHIVYEDADDTVGVALRKVGRSQFLEVQADSTGAVSIEIPLIFLEEAIAEFWEVCGEEPYAYGQGNPAYDRGYDDGCYQVHDDAYDDGYDSGYNEGYAHGRRDERDGVGHD